MEHLSGNRFELLCIYEGNDDSLDTIIHKIKTKNQQSKKDSPLTANAGKNQPEGTQKNKKNATKKKSNNVLAAKENSEPANKSDHKDGGEKKFGGKKDANWATNEDTGSGNDKYKKWSDRDTNHNNPQDSKVREDGKFVRRANFKSTNYANNQTEDRDYRKNRRNRDENGSTVPDQQRRERFHVQSNFDKGNDGFPREDRRIGTGDRSERHIRGGGRDGSKFGNGEHKRSFDRQSGSERTGVKSVDKREGAGAHNWGSAKQDLEDINGFDDDVSGDRNEQQYEEQQVDGWKDEQQQVDGWKDEEQQVEGWKDEVQHVEGRVDEAQQVPGWKDEDSQINEEETAVVEEVKQITMDEWYAQRAARPKPQFNIRKAGEGEDLSKWKKMIVLNNKKSVETEEEFEFDPTMYPQRVGRLKRINDIEIHFKDRRRFGSFKFRGGGRFARDDQNRGNQVKRGEGDEGQRKYENRRNDDGRADIDQGRRNRDDDNLNLNEAEQNNAEKVYDERNFPTLC